MSPTIGGSRFFRDEPNTTTPPPSLLRRKTDFRDSNSNVKLDEKEKAKEGAGNADASSPFGSLKRSTTTPLGAGLTGTSAAWPAASATQNTNFSPMGAFGSFSLGSSNTQTTSVAEKRPGYGSVRGESRFKGLLSKDSSEDVGALARDKGVKLSENEGGSRPQSPWGEPIKTRNARSETNPFAEEARSGSAALGGSQDIGAPQGGVDELGFSAFGMTAGAPGIRDLLGGRGENAHDLPAHLHGLEPTSPTNTNPYQSPRGEKADVDDIDTDGSDVQRSQLPDLSGLREDSTAAPFGSIRRGGSGLDLSAGDRSQTSSTGPGRSFSSLGGLGNVSGLGTAGGWPTGAIGTPTRERSAFPGFGDPIFGSMAEMQSPSLSTLGGGGFFGSGLGTGSIGRASKMGSLFPAAMQEQMQGEQARQDSERQQGELTISRF
jgi:PERQ amino acid-rich with GYF domain-containing protein